MICCSRTETSKILAFKIISLHVIAFNGGKQLIASINKVTRHLIKVCNDDEEIKTCSTTSENLTISMKKNHPIMIIIDWILCTSLIAPIISSLVYVTKDHILYDEETNDSNITLQENTWGKKCSKIITI